MKKLKLLLPIIATLMLIACKENSENQNVVEDGADKSGVTETGQHIGSTTDSTTVISDEPNPSND